MAVTCGPQGPGCVLHLALHTNSWPTSARRGLSFSDEEILDQRYIFHVCLKSFLKCLLLRPKGKMPQARSPGERDRKCVSSLLGTLRPQSRPVVRMCAQVPVPAETTGDLVGGPWQFGRHRGREQSRSPV